MSIGVEQNSQKHCLMCELEQSNFPFSLYEARVCVGRGMGRGEGRGGGDGHFPDVLVGVCHRSLRSMTHFYNPERAILG